MIPWAVYAQVIDAAVPPIMQAVRTRWKRILATRPNIAPTRTPLAINGIQTNTISPKKPALPSMRFLLLCAMNSTEERISATNWFCNKVPVIPSCCATKVSVATILLSPDFLSTTVLRSSERPAATRSAMVSTVLIALTITRRSPSIPFNSDWIVFRNSRWTSS